MYGSHFYYQSSMLKSYNSSQPFEQVTSLENIPSMNWVKVLIVILGLSLSAIVYASPSEPKFSKGLPLNYER